MNNLKLDFPWGHERRFNAYSPHFKKRFGTRVQKLSINAGFTCPNRDGRLGTKGCTFCLNEAFNPSYCTPEKSISQQIEEGKHFHAKRYRKASAYLAYFQAYTNTYSHLPSLEKKYLEALSTEQVIGLVIGTRPDCIDREKLAFFAELAKKYYVIIEYGIESCYNKTLDRIHRGHTFEKTKESILLTKEYGLTVGGHLIFGLPTESKDEMLEQASLLSSLPLDQIKFHQLQILKDTEIEKDFSLHPQDFHLFSLDEYVDFIVDFLERLRPSIIVERFASEVPPRFLAKETWELMRSEEILRRVEQRLEERDTHQGRLYEEKSARLQ